MQQESGDRALVTEIINDLMKRDDLWPDYVDALSDAEGLDMDFPEADERVGRVWELNGRMLDAARELLLSMKYDRHLHMNVNAALWRAAWGKA